MKLITTLLTLAIATLNAQPIKVFILAGQSNMEGQGVVSLDGEKDYNGGKGNLVWSMKHSNSVNKLKKLKNEKDEWVVRDDVQISFKVGETVRKGGLTIGYGYAAKPHIPVMKEIITTFNTEVERKEFPSGDLNNQRVKAVEDAIKSIEAATEHPPLRSISSPPAK